MLRHIQARLTELYDVSLDACVEDFVCDHEVARTAIGQEVTRGEVLLVAEEPDGVLVGLYVDPQALASLGTDEGHAEAWLEDDGRFAASCLATEGVSHFVYLMFRAENHDGVSQLELELQAEVDKYATALLAGNGVGAIRERSRALRQRLFVGVRFLDPEGTEEGERYRLANRLAGVYAEGLERRFVDRGDLAALSSELRRFYRLGGLKKLEATRCAG